MGFVELVAEGRVKDLETLKRLYRISAKRAHPDTGDLGHEAFLVLKADFERAKALLSRIAIDPRPKPVKGPAREPSREGFYRELQGFVARGFPRQPRGPSAASIYRASREAIMKELPAMGRAWLDAFVAFESALAPMPGSWAARTAYGQAREVVYLTLTFHDWGFKQYVPQAERALPQAEAALASVGASGAGAFLRLLVDDMSKGGASAPVVRKD